jgi:AraC-like DNA-binding protein
VTPAGVVLINPPPGRLGESHALLWGRGRRHHVVDFLGPLSIKAVIRGRAVWETDGRRFEIDPLSWIVVNPDQPYTLTIEATEPVETFCLFFRRGAVEEIGRVLTTSDTALLDRPDGAPDPGRGRPAFHLPTFRARDARIAEPLRQAHRMLSRGTDPGPWLEESVLTLGENLLRLKEEVLRDIARVPAARASTRVELFRRLRRALDLIEATLDRPMRLEEVASAACLSPYHFHRLFTATQGETPHHYARRRRLERARDRLERSDDTVTDISLEYGFESLSSFSLLFRRRFGLPPARYRRVHRENRKNEEESAAPLAVPSGRKSVPSPARAGRQEEPR